VPPWRPGLAAVVAFTGHAFVALDPEHLLEPAVQARLDGFGGAHHPAVATAIAGPGGWIDSLDSVLVAHGVGGPPILGDRPDLAAHARVAFAAGVRSDVRVVGPPVGDAFVTIGRGLGGLSELGVAVGDTTSGRQLLRDALTMIPAGEVTLAAVAPGNARALRAFLAAGFRPVASVQLLRPA